MNCVPSTIWSLIHHKKASLWTKKPKRDFIYVDDVNDFHLMCIENSDTNNEVFNIGSGKNYSIK